MKLKELRTKLAEREKYQSELEDREKDIRSWIKEAKDAPQWSNSYRNDERIISYESFLDNVQIDLSELEHEIDTLMCQIEDMEQDEKDSAQEMKND